MRKLFALLLIFSLAAFTVNTVSAQEGDTTTQQTQDAGDSMEDMEDESAAAAESMTVIDEGEAPTMFQVLKKNFIDGDWKFSQINYLKK